MAEGSSGRAVTLAALTVASLAAGFLATHLSATSGDFDQVGRVDVGSKAYGIDLTAGQRMRLERSGDASALGVAVYDPQDRFFAHFRLDHGEPVEVLADRSGTWVIVPTLGDGANLTVSVATGDAAGEVGALDPLPIRKGERTVVDQEAGALDARMALRIHRRPALAYLAVDGTAQGLDASLRSETGTVFSLEAAQVNSSDARPPAPRSVELSPGHLVDGTYHVTASAERFEGRLVLVHATYVRSDGSDPLSNASLPGLEDEGIRVGSAHRGEALLVEGQGADRLRFAAARDTTARIYVFDGQDDLTEIVRMGRGSGYRWEWSEEAANATLETETIPIDGTSRYAVYVETLGGHGDRIHVLLPGLRTAHPAEELEIVQTRLELGGETVTREATQTLRQNLSGALVDIELSIQDLASDEHRIRVSGPRGLVLDHREQTTLAGESLSRYHQEHPSHFSDGRFRIRVDAETTVESQVELRLFHYRR